MRTALVWALLAAGLALAAPAASQEEAAELEGWAYQLPHDLMSPFCPGRTLAECPSPNADSLRMWLIVQEAAGRSRDEVEAELLERFGEGILAAPRARGFGLAAYLIPVLTFLAGGVLVVFVLRRLTRPRQAPGAASPERSVDPELERLVDEDLSR